MARDLYTRIISTYRPLARDGDTIEISDKRIARATAIAEQYMPTHENPNVSTDNPVYAKASRLVIEYGIDVPAQEVKVTQSFLERYARDEVSALVNVAAHVVAEIEEENDRKFMEENLPDMMIKAMQELYVGKIKIRTKQQNMSGAVR